MRATAARVATGIADNKVRRPANPRMIVLLYGAGRRISSLERLRLKKYRHLFELEKISAN
jgi:hypothetical protein